MKKIILIVIVLMVFGAAYASATGEVSGGIYGFCYITSQYGEAPFTCLYVSSPSSCSASYGCSCPAGYTLIQFNVGANGNYQTFACYKN